MVCEATKRLVAASMFVASLAAPFSIVHAQAQTTPEAGDIARQDEQTLRPPRQRPEIRINGEQLETLESGGGEVEIRELLLSGTNAISDDELFEVIGPYRDESFDLAGLQEIANTISQHYRDQGYPFARAYLPAQDIFSGIVRIDVLEGRYGEVELRGLDGDENLSGADRFLKPLSEGRVVQSQRLERAALLLDEQPGFNAFPVIRPGERLGTGDLDVRVSADRRVAGSIGADNHGNYYSGEWRGRATLQARRSLVFGDQLVLSGLYTEQNTQLLDLAYELPLNGNGLRARIGYVQSEYELGRTAEGQFGESTTHFIEFPYALKRSQSMNLTLVPRAETNDLSNGVEANSGDLTFFDKDSQVYPLSLRFDRRDGLGGGGVIYGRVTGSFGHMNGTIDSAANTFVKYRLNAARLQSLPFGLQGLVRFVGQETTDNLDGSEGITLGGANGVRAFPQGEGSGDTGYYAQLELRYAIGQTGLVPYAFYDIGSSRPYGGDVPSGQSNESRDLAGGGIGLRFNQGRFSVTAAAAWRDQGGEPQAALDNDKPQGWITGSVTF